MMSRGLGLCLKKQQAKSRNFSALSPTTCENGKAAACLRWRLLAFLAKDEVWSAYGQKKPCKKFVL